MVNKSPARRNPNASSGPAMCRPACESARSDSQANNQACCGVPSDDSVLRSIAAARTGDQAAMFHLDLRLRADIVTFIRYRRQNRTKIDSQSIANQVLQRLWSGLAKDKKGFIFASRADVKKLLFFFARQILADEHRFYSWECRDWKREQQDGQYHVDRVDDRKSDAQHVSELLEEVFEVVRERHTKAIDILELRIEGYSNSEIAESLELAPRTVQQIVQRCREAWERFEKDREQ